MRRGDLVIVSAQGDYGKPRPAVIIQNDRLASMLDSVVVCFLTSDVENTKHLRIVVDPDSENGLRDQSHIQIDKIMTFPKDKVRGPIGCLNAIQMKKVDRGLLALLDLLPPIIAGQVQANDER